MAVVPHVSFKISVLGWLAGRVVRALAFSVRSKVTLDPGFLAYFQHKPVVFVCWHNRLLLAPYHYARHLGHRPVSVLTSASKDGGLLAGVVKCFGMGAVRGSSSRGGAVALVQMKKTILSGSSIAITPDGPRGPCYHFAPGALKLAQITGAPVVPVTVECSKAWRLRSWDRFAIPKPFSKARIHFHAPHHLPADLTPEALETARLQIEKVLQPQEMG